MIRTKAKAGSSEKLDIAAIIAALHNQTPSGVRMCNAYLKKFRANLYDARERVGSDRSTHYDFQILVGPSRSSAAWKNVEHKGSTKYSVIGPEETPWAAGVQFHNGGCDKYTIGSLYARSWYDVHVGSGTLKSTWAIEAPIPTFDDWYEKDAKRQSDPTTAFGRELKQKVRVKLGDGKSLTADGYRESAHAAFNPTAADIDLFKSEALTVLNDALDKKDVWLTIHGDIAGDFHCAWYPKFTLSAIDEVTIRKEKDLWFDFRCGTLSFSLLMRWGKGVGFSNLRIDAR